MINIYDYDNEMAHRSDQGRKIILDFEDQYSIRPGGYETSLIPAQTKVYDLTPKLTETTRLLQTNVRKSWTTFRMPPNFTKQPMAHSLYLAPHLGGVEQQERLLDLILAFVKSQPNASEEVKNQSQTLIDMIQDLRDKNQMVDYIIARILQYVH